MSKIAKRVLALLIALMAAFTFTACSDDNGDNGDDKSKENTSQNGKPSADEVKEGVLKGMKEQVSQDEFDALGEEAFSQYANCIVDEIYDEASDDTLKALSEGNVDYEMSDEELAKFEEAAGKCAAELIS